MIIFAQKNTIIFPHCMTVTKPIMFHTKGNNNGEPNKLQTKFPMKQGCMQNNT